MRRAIPGKVCAAVAVLALAASAGTFGCAKHPTAVTRATWVFGSSEPGFDPAGPPDFRRWSLERLLTKGLVAEDSTGRIVKAAAESIGVSNDSLVWTFRLPANLAFVDGSRCRSEDFRRALVAGIARSDHGTRPWLLSAVRGVDAVRAAKPLPKLGIETPDERTLVLHLAWRDPLLLRKLAVPGVCDAWSSSTADWRGALGLGPYRVLEAEPGRRMQLVRVAHPTPGPWRDADTLTVRFGITAGRAREMLRQGAVDLVWPMPVGLLDEDLPPGYRTRVKAARPRVEMLLVMRADLPPTSMLPARMALAHGINRDDIVHVLGPGASGRLAWLAGADPAQFPALDGEEVRAWLERGDLGNSFHVDMAYRSDGQAAAAARLLQGEWSRYGIYVELKALRGEKFTTEALSGYVHLLLVEHQAVIDDPSAELAAYVMPLRGPAVGAFRTGWRIREFDPWILPRHGGAAPAPVAQVERRLEEEDVVLPLGVLPWAWIERTSSPSLPVHPHFGPQCRLPASTDVAAR